MSWILVKLSDLFETISPANFSRYRDELSYGEWQFENAHRSFKNFFKHYSSFENKIIADVGCGDGGKTRYYEGYNPRAVIGIDIDLQKIINAKKYKSAKKLRSKKLQFAVMNISESAFKNKHFDICISEDGFEHFSAPDTVLGEVNRILKKGGLFFILFTPYFGSPGPHLYNWIRLPYAHLLFSDQTMIKAARIIAQRKVYSNTPSIETPIQQVEREIYQFKHFINKITFRRFKKYLLRSSDYRLVCLHKYCSRKIYIPFIYIPFISELFLSIFCVLEKAPGQRVKRTDLFLKGGKGLKKVV